jgi:hypothetical protein
MPAKKKAVSVPVKKTAKKTAAKSTPKSNNGYVSRLVDAAAEATGAGEDYVKAKFVYDRAPLPVKTPNRTKALKQMKERVREERGQFFGALLQGRQYDSQGKLIKAKNKSSKKK